MPVLSRFYGVVIKMFFRRSEHNPPHIHALYGEYAGLVDIETGEMLEGDLPERALSLVREWTAKYRDELTQIWDTQQFCPLPPLD
ncbi:DUF4160 domain-containing protein [Treponema endosymbiont of Eucomonympha sp.]|jgi:hypothetical protein|uniref:DUF4160 domain-containing protein n=1 Tax=Treponema endosymbiont of Eucomonympha sp. TaxID=1580831 RepID=UPI000781F3B8|nr:DUF4160 domain-containing protein [Treponema endosymbiont of Eucomonympha sp.]